MGSALILMYFSSCVTGLSFGVMNSQWKTLSWMMLPSGANYASAMGFATVVQITSTGIGSFCSGLILSYFENVKHGYSLKGYIVMTMWCVLLIFSSIVVQLHVIRTNGWSLQKFRNMLFF
jgi:hypothetical protein